MSIFACNSEPLRAYRAAAAELHEFSFTVEKKLEEAGESGELEAAKEALSELSLRTKAFEELRTRLTPLDLFIAKYGVVALDDHTVSFVLPKGSSRIGLLREAQELSEKCHESDPEKYWAKRAISEEELKNWESESIFSEVTEKTFSLIIDGNVKGSTGHTRKEQAYQGWNNVALQDLAVAHTVFYLLTGKDLFGENIVRYASGALRFNIDGLVVLYYVTEDRNSLVSASRSLSAPN